MGLERNGVSRLPIMNRENGQRCPRVAVVLTQLGRGGAERQTVELLRGLRERPWRPTVVVCLSEDLHPFGEEVTALGYRLEVIRRFKSFDPGRLAELRRLLVGHRIELVHAVHLLASGYSFLATRGLREVSVLPTVRGTVVAPGPIRSVVYRWMFHSCRRVLANSHRGAAFVERKFRIPSNRIVVIPNGVDFSGLRDRSSATNIRELLGVAADAPIVAYVGKHSRVKNVPRFLAMWAEVAPSVPKAHAVLVGGGLGHDARRDLLGACPPDRTHFLGPRDDVPSVLAQADVLVLTSNSEGAPNVVLESLALGTPVVSTDVGDVSRMVVHGRTGFVVEDGSVAELVKSVRSVLTRPDEFRSAVRSDAARVEAEYSLDGMISGTTRLWGEISRHEAR